MTGPDEEQDTGPDTGRDNALWQQCWRDNDTEFHQKTVNRALIRFWSALGLAPGDRIFVPLCGKSLDLLWLAAQGHSVVGVELSPIAVRAFFKIPEHLKNRRCTPGDACIRAHSGRQIDRFLRANQELAHNYLSDIFWERRAIAARYAAVNDISPLKSDSDEVVRRVVATRLPVDQLISMVGDPDREVRLSVAARLPEPLLVKLIDDPDYLIRATVARRLPHGQLSELSKDPEREVRKVVAARLPPFALHMLADDPEPEVRAIVAERALPGLAAAMLQDSEWWVRLAALANAPLEFLQPLTQDPEAEVREAAQARLAEENDI